MEKNKVFAVIDTNVIVSATKNQIHHEFLRLFLMVE